MRKRGRPRRGIVNWRAEWASGGVDNMQFEIVELERAGELSRVRVVRVTGTTYLHAKALLPGWLNQSDVQWLTEVSA
jgi:hypothetical protein